MKRILSLLLAAFLLFGIIPLNAFATDVVVAVTISYVYVGGLDFPVTGEEADFEAALPSGVGYELAAPSSFENFYNGVSWYDVTANRYLAPGDVYESGHRYMPVFALAAKSGFAFASPSAMTGETGYADSVTIGEFQNVSSSTYITVHNEMADGSWEIEPLERSAVNVTYGSAYDADGNLISEAVEGETVSLIAAGPASSDQIFNGWVVEAPVGLELEITGTKMASFTMPDEPVSIYASFEPVECSYVYVALDACVEGREADFTAEATNGSVYYSSYHFEAPEGYESNFYNGVCWYDATEYKYLQPGDVFVGGHEYTVRVAVAANDGYEFVDISSMRGKVTFAPTCEFTNFVGADSTKWLEYISSETIVPYTEKNISITNGIAYNEDGEVITKAARGDKVTVTAVDETGVRSFLTWQNNCSATIYFYDESATSTTFVMPDSDVDIEAVYTDCIVEGDVTITLKGFYTGAKATQLQVTADKAGVDFSPTATTGLDYSLLLDSNGFPSTTEVTGTISSSKLYWIAVKLVAADGYDISELGDVLLTNSTDSIVRVLSDGSVVAYFKLPASASALTYSVNVTGGTAYINGQTVTSAVPGMKIDIVADEPGESMAFDGWTTTTSGLLIADKTSTSTFFTMPYRTANVTAQFITYITEINITDLEKPVADNSPDYAAVFPEDAGYEICVSDFEGYVNGIRWDHMTRGDEYVGAILDESSVFESNCNYTVSLLIKTKDGYRFNRNADNTGYELTGTVNGESAWRITATTVYEKDQYLILTMYYSVPLETATVSGTVSNYDTTGTYAVISFYSADESEVLYSCNVYGSDYSFSIDNVVYDSYRVKVEMEAHGTRWLALEVNEAELTLDTVLCLLGDVSGDGKLNARDTLLIKQYGAGKELTEYQTVCADINCDGKINARDTMLLKRMQMGLY